MAIAFGSSTQLTTTAGTTITTAVDVGSGANRMLVVTGNSSTSTDQLTKIEYAGVAMTLIHRISAATTGDRWMYMAILPNPTAGSNNLVVTNASSQPWFAGSANVYTGVTQSNTPDASGTNFTQTTLTGTVTLTTVVNNSWLMSYVENLLSDPTASTGTTKRDNAGTSLSFGDSNAALPAGSNTMSWSGTSVAHWNLLYLSLSPAAAAAASVPFKTLLGVGV